MEGLLLYWPRVGLDSHIRYTTKERSPHAQVTAYKHEQYETPRPYTLPSPHQSIGAQDHRKGSKENYLDEPKDTEIKRMIANLLREFRFKEDMNNLLNELEENNTKGLSHYQENTNM